MPSSLIEDILLDASNVDKALLRAHLAQERDVVIASMKPGNSAAANKTALVAAITYLGSGGGEILIPRGTYGINPNIEIDAENITIRGVGSAKAYEGSAAGTRLVFTAGTIGFDCTDIVSAGNYTLFKNLFISGNGVLDTAIKANGQNLIEHCAVQACLVAGVWWWKLINNASIRHSSFCYNLTGYGLLIGGTGNDGTNTLFSVDDVVLGGNLTGLRITNAVHGAVRNTVSESNEAAGLEIYKPSGIQCDYLTFDHFWLEDNEDGTDYQATIDSQLTASVGDKPGWITFNSPQLSSTGSTRALNVISSHKLKVIDGVGTGAVTLAAQSSLSRVVDWNGGTITDSGDRNYTEERQYGAGYTGGPLYSKEVGAAGFTFPTARVASANPTTLGWFKKGTFTASLTGCTTVPTVTVDYTMTDNSVTLCIPQIAGTSNATTKTLTGMPAEIRPVNNKIVTGATVQDNTGAYVVAPFGINPSGVIDLYATANFGAWTASGTTTIRSISCSYLLT